MQLDSGQREPERLQPSRISADHDISGQEFDTEHQSDTLRLTDTNVTDEIFKNTDKVREHHDDVCLCVNTTITDTSRVIPTLRLQPAPSFSVSIFDSETSFSPLSKLTWSPGRPTSLSLPSYLVLLLRWARPELQLWRAQLCGRCRNSESYQESAYGGRPCRRRRRNSYKISASDNLNRPRRGKNNPASGG
eukprot:220562-Rhodomonas_salina.3